MREQYKTVVAPAEYRGWALAYSHQHSGNNYNATKGVQTLWAASLTDLLGECDRAELVTVRLKRALQALHHDGYSSAGWKPAAITTLADGLFHYVDHDGETKAEHLSKLNLDRERNPQRRWILNTRENLAKLRKARDLRRKAAALEQEADKLSRSCRPLTEADIKIAAGVGNAAGGPLSGG